MNMGQNQTTRGTTTPQVSVPVSMYHFGYQCLTQGVSSIHRRCTLAHVPMPEKTRKSLDNDFRRPRRLNKSVSGVSHRLLSLHERDKPASEIMQRRISYYCGWAIRSHHFETMGHHCLLVFTGESPFQAFLGGSGFRPSIVQHCTQNGRTIQEFTRQKGARRKTEPSP